MYDPLIKISSIYTNTISDDEKSTRHLLFGISTSQHKILTWEIIYKKGDSNSNTDCLISYRGCQDMNWEKEPDLLVSNNQWFESTVSKLLYRFQVKYGKVALLAVSMDTSIHFYDYSITVPENVEWEEIYKLDTGLRNTLFISFINNIVAIVTKSEDKYNLSIWMEMRSSATPCLTKSFEFSEPIIGISWSVTSDSQFILAVAFQHKVSIFGQKRATRLEDDNIWILYSDIEMDTEDDVNGVTWLDNGVLIVTAGNQVRCYLKWITNQDSVNESGQCINVSSLYELSYVANGPLPIYHPRHLLHYLLWGKISLINAILQSLYKSLRQIYIVDDEQGNDIIQFVPTLSLDKIIELQNIDEKNINQQQQYQALFDDSQEDILTIDENDVSKQLSREEADQLIKYLKARRLPRLSENEINQLLAMVDTFAEISSQGESLDENGARFTVLLEHHFHLNKILPPEQRKQQLDSRDIAYALHSQSQDLLLDRCIRLCDGKLLWEDARAMGIFIWLQKSDVVNEQMLAIARNTYLAKETKDPVDCTLFYLALRKKALLQNLWRSCSFHKEQRVMVKFLANDFTQPRWQTAAAKNAFVLLGRQRFEYAASFFLLADRLKDAINVILKNLRDYHLAIAICRVYDGDSSPLLKEIINDYVIPLAIETNDRWLLTTGLWFNGKIHDAIRSIVVPLSQIKINENKNKNEFQVNPQQQEEENDSVATVNDPTLFILYQHVKQLHHRQELGISYDLEYNFSLQVTRAYERLGCPLLSLYILLRYPMKRPLKALLPSSSSDTNTVENEKQQESRAADLFSDNEPTPAIENDIFADMNTTKPSRAIDIFGDDDDNNNSKFSTATDIFADVNTKPSYATNIFDDDDDNEKDIFNSNKINTSTNIFDMDFGDNNETDNDNKVHSDASETEDDNDLRSYKAQLIIRMVQTIFNSASILYHSPPDSAAVAKYRNQYIENRKTLIELGEKQGISKLYIYKLLIEKCVELDVFPLYFDILDNHNVLDNFNIPQFLYDFQLGCFEIFDSIIILNNDVISTFPVWSQLIKAHLLDIDSTNKTFKIALSAYICLILITTKQRHYERSWTLLYHFPKFINHIFEEDPTETVISIFKELTKNEAKMVEMDTDNFDSFSDDSVFGFDLNEEQYKPLHDFNDNSLGAVVLETASLNLILSTIEQGMHYNRNKNVKSDQLVEFIWSYLLNPIAYRLHHLQSQIDKELNHKLTRSKYYTFFFFYKLIIIISIVRE
ncbi:RAVE protein 1 C terminal-domain-containing protein [Cunninghamella echinulata]|nr:RAVE protein 1 C terminal-domain-containing protein [Cunninghamella echinulata]